MSRGPFVSKGRTGWWTTGLWEGFPRQKRDGAGGPERPAGRLRGLGAALCPAYESGPAGLTLALQFGSFSASPNKVNSGF